MKLPIYAYGHPLLRKISEDITSSYPDLDKLIDDMFETMYESAGVGLAAPQTGRNIRLFIVDATPYKDQIKNNIPLKYIFINPKIIKQQGIPWRFEEGCLSIPDIREDVERQPVVTMEYLDENFEPHKKTFDGILARIIQHEYDHLEGVLFVDHISNIRKLMLKRKLRDIMKGKIEPPYKMRFAKRN